MPQNGWISDNPPFSLGIYRSIPFLLLGLLIIVLFWKRTRGGQDRTFRFLWLTIVLSFGFYLPVVLFADTFPAIGMLMVPKACAYVWGSDRIFCNARKYCERKRESMKRESVFHVKKHTLLAIAGCVWILVFLRKTYEEEE